MDLYIGSPIGLENNRQLAARRTASARQSTRGGYSLNLDRHELRDAAGIPQRVGDVLGGQFAHDQCQVAFEGCLDGDSIDPLHVFRGTSTTNHFHQKFCVLHSLLCSLEVLLRRSRCTDEKGNADGRNRFSAAGESNQPILFR